MKYDVSLQTIAWFNARRSDGTLVISPKFQRRPVWLTNERSTLMATIAEKLPFPEVYIHHQTDPETGKEMHVVVDGQQRITSILMFIDGDAALPDDDHWKARTFKEFDAEEKQDFWTYKVVVRSLSHTNDAEIRDLFTRLNTNNMALNDQELRNARHKGRFKDLAERMADNSLFQDIGLFTAREVRRMLDVEFASELLLLTVEGPSNKKDLLDSAYANYDEEFPRESEYENDFNATIGLVRTILSDANKTQAKRKSNFYSLYGASLRYYRTSHRSAFRRPDDIAAKIADLFEATRTGMLEGKPTYYVEYFDSVSRAASDKSRRFLREVILSRIITEVEG